MASIQNDFFDFLGLSTQPPKCYFFVLNVLKTCNNNGPLKLQVLSSALYLLTEPLGRSIPYPSGPLAPY